MEQIIDMAIIGAGAAGLSAAVNGLARGKSIKVFSNKSNYLSRAERVDNYLGFYGINGQSLMDAFYHHASTMGVMPSQGKVVNIIPFDGRFLINFNGNIVEAKTVILAVGIAKTKPIRGEAALLGKGVSYCATCDGMLYKGKRAVVCGMADDMTDEANFLQSIGVEVIFVSPLPREDALHKNIMFISGFVSGIAGESLATGAIVGGETIPADVIFILRNALAPAALLEDLEIENGFITVNRWMETNISGIYACGDCTGAPLQVAKAVGEGLIAALQAAKYIDEHKEAY